MEKQIEFLVPFNKAEDVDKIALIDADYIKYLVTNDIFKDIKTKRAVIYKNPIHHYTQRRIDNIINSFNAKGYLFCFSGPSDNTFRCSVSFDKKYKGNRSYVENYENELQDKIEVVKYIRARYPSVKYNDLEADDLLCMLQDESTFIYSNDKDLLQIPGIHWDIKKGVFLEVSNEDAMMFLMKQMLTGDTVDNISGLKGCGEVGATKLLTDVSVKNQPFTILMEYMKKHGAFNGIDSFVEAWNLLKLRGNRGDFFLSKYKGAFDTLRLIKNS
jgi:5'-3' exonuclease